MSKDVYVLNIIVNSYSLYNYYLLITVAKKTTELLTLSTHDDLSSFCKFNHH